MLYHIWNSTNHVCDVTTRAVVFISYIISILQAKKTAKTKGISERKEEFFELNYGNQTKDILDSSEDSGSKEDEFDEEFEAANAWPRTTLDWCESGKCTILKKTIGSFCCHKKALGYNKYDDKLTSAQNLELNCITSLSSFVQNMLSKGVLAVDVSQHLEGNWFEDD